MILEAAIVAFAQMRAHPLRTLLTLTGIIIAIASVIGVGSLMTSVQTLVQTTMESTGGLNNLHVMYKEFREVRGQFLPSRVGNPLNEEDGHVIKSLFPDAITATSARINTQAQVLLRDGEQRLSVTGVEPAFFAIYNRQIQEGRFFDQDELARAALVTVVSSTARRKLFLDGRGLGEEVRMNTLRLRVVGVVDDLSLGGEEKVDLYIPVTTARLRFPLRNRRSPDTMLHIQAKPETDFNQLKSTILQVLLTRHPATEAASYDFLTPDAGRQDASKALYFISLIFALIASLCLLTGGIGVMNVLLSSVSERTREIGVRRAVGARSKDIFLQFLIESLCLTSVGGIIGIGAGYAVGLVLGLLVNQLMTLGQSSGPKFQLQPSLNPALMLIALATASVVGIVFGTYPAKAASAMDPSEALRVE
jgi:putative ABC transport system permease protein